VINKELQTKRKDLGKYTYPEGDEYEGIILNGLPHGQGVKIDQVGFKFEGFFFRGKETGKFKIYLPDGTFSHEETYKNGEVVQW